jgi:hypothetical protein
LLFVCGGKLVDLQLQQNFLGDALRHAQRKVPSFHLQLDFPTGRQPAAAFQQIIRQHETVVVDG